MDKINIKNPYVEKDPNAYFSRIKEQAEQSALIAKVLVEDPPIRALGRGGQFELPSKGKHELWAFCLLSTRAEWERMESDGKDPDFFYAAPRGSEVDQANSHVKEPKAWDRKEQSALELVGTDDS